MVDLRKAIKKYLKEKTGIDIEDLEKEEKPVLEMRKKQGGGMWQADIGIDGEEEEEKKKKKKATY